MSYLARGRPVGVLPCLTPSLLPYSKGLEVLVSVNRVLLNKMDQWDLRPDATSYLSVRRSSRRRGFGLQLRYIELPTVFHL